MKLEDNQYLIIKSSGKYTVEYDNAVYDNLSSVPDKEIRVYINAIHNINGFYFKNDEVSGEAAISFDFSECDDVCIYACKIKQIISLASLEPIFTISNGILDITYNSASGDYTLENGIEPEERQFNQLTKVNEEILENITVLSDRIKNLNNEIEVNKAEQAKIEAEIAEAEKNYSKADEELVELKAQCKDYENKIKELNEKYDNKKADFELYKKTNDSIKLQEKIDNIDKESRSLISDLSKVFNIPEADSDSILESCRASVVVAGAYDKLEEEVKKYNDYIKKLKELDEGIRSKLESSIRTREDLIDDIRNKADQV